MTELYDEATEEQRRAVFHAAVEVGVANGCYGQLPVRDQTLRDAVLEVLHPCPLPTDAVISTSFQNRCAALGLVGGGTVDKVRYGIAWGLRIAMKLPQMEHLDAKRSWSGLSNELERLAVKALEPKP